MRPVLFEIPPVPLWGWIVLLFGFFGLSAYWGVNEALAGVSSREERWRRSWMPLLANLLLFLVGVVLVWRFRQALERPLPVRAYGFLLMLAFAIGLVYLQRVSRGTALSAETAVDLILGLLLVTVLSARLVYVLLHWSQYAGDWRSLFRVWEGGLSFHGGLLGGILWVKWFAWRHQLGFLWLADLMAPGVALGYAVARVGCFLNGCCYGGPTSLPWAVRFQDPPLSNHWTVPSHPVQIYASLANLAFFFLLLAWLRQKRFDGEVFGVFLVLYSAYRFGAEWLRKGVTATVLAMGLTQAQWASLAIAVGGALMVVLLARRAEQAPKGTIGKQERQEVQARPKRPTAPLSSEGATRPKSGASPSRKGRRRR